MKTLYVIRHCHRDLSDRSLDNGLSSKGWGQARQILDWFQSKNLPTPPELLSSPKLRCRETLLHLSNHYKVPVRLDPGLEEQRPQEDSSDFGRRVLRWFNAWDKTTQPITLICSHGDWIPLLIALATGQRKEVGKGSVILLESIQGRTQAPSYQLKHELP